MREVETEYFDLYKRIDSICRDMFRNEHLYKENGEEVFGVGAYIACLEVKKRSYGNVAYPQIDDSLRLLKNLRHIRNQISHDASSDCDEGSLAQLDRFYRSLLERTDILSAIYRSERQRAASRAAARRAAQPRVAVNSPQSAARALQKANPAPKRKSGLWVLIALGGAVALFLIYLVVRTFLL
ncbi:MAG: hypothetical protein IKX41_00515 [Oscillospiraceae bacterium]|nr:hypothetical protein [Oscillospiraceae bacterium]